MRIKEDIDVFRTFMAASEAVQGRGASADKWKVERAVTNRGDGWLAMAESSSGEHMVVLCPDGERVAVKMVRKDGQPSLVRRAERTGPWADEIMMAEPGEYKEDIN